MTDVLGYRAKFGVLGPATNTIVQPEFDEFRPKGVTNHYSRIFVENANAISNESFMKGTQVISENTLDAVRHVMPCAPDYLVMGMSAVTFYDGAKGCIEWKKPVEDLSNFFSDYGYDTVADQCLQCPSWRAIAEVSNETTRKVFLDMNSDEVDAIIQVGTNLSAVTLAADMEKELGKPVIAINTATYWHALRTCGINDKMSGFGRLLDEF